jgi:glycosyltransferase involved in cell wall biosynthesis
MSPQLNQKLRNLFLGWNARGLPFPMGRYAYAFAHYRQQRKEMLPHYDLRKLTWSAEMGLVTIVLPVYNGEEYLGEAIESVFGQTYQHWELIAVDDGSTDSTPQILGHFAAKDTRLKIIQQSNHKLPQALNTGFKQANGEFLTWISADNRLAPDFLTRMVDCLTRHPGWDMAFANLDLIGEEGIPLLGSDWYADYQKPPGSQHIHLPQSTSRLNTIPNNSVGAAFLYRARTAGLLGGYSPTWFTAEDYDYWLRVNEFLLLEHADFEEPVYEYRFHSQSLTHLRAGFEINDRRQKLLIFDDFRRDSALSPIYWMIDIQDDPETRQAANLLADLIRDSQHILIEQQDLSTRQVWGPPAPAIHVHFTCNSQCEVPVTHFPGLDFKHVLVLIEGFGEKSFKIAGKDWDLYAALNSTKVLPELMDGWCGWLEAPDVNTLFVALDIWVRAHFYSNCEQNWLSTPMPPSKKLSVIICTRQRKELIQNAIHSIAHQTLAPEVYEIILVNNDSQDHNFEIHFTNILKDALPSGSTWKIIHCPVPGLSQARNAGLAAASGEILCFLDDDAVAEPGWLSWVLRTFEEHPKLGAAGGAILVNLPEPAPGWLKPGMEIYWSHFAPKEKSFQTVVDWYNFPWGANWWARRQAMLEIGGFRKRYGRREDDFGGGEEVIAAALIQQLGFSIGVEPRAVVHHNVEAGRFSLQHLRRTILAGKISWYRAWRDLYIQDQMDLFSTLKRVVRETLVQNRPFSFYRAFFTVEAEIRLIVQRARDFWLSLRPSG